MLNELNFTDGLGATSSSQDQTNRRGARWVWTIGGTQVVLCGWAVLILAVYAAMPSKEFADSFQGQIPTDQLPLVHRLMWHVALSMCVLGFLPGLAYIYLGFGIRTGGTHPTRIAVGLSLMQSILLGVLLIRLIAWAIWEASPAKCTISVLMLGTPLFVLIYCIRALLHARLAQSFAENIEVDPWR